MLQDADRAMEEDKKENKENKDAGKREKEKTVIDGTMCIWIGDCHPKYMLLQPMEKEAFETLAAEAGLIKKEVSVPFCIIGIAVESGNQDLSPWEAEPVFGQEKFGGQAAAFLERIEIVLLPKLFLEHGKDGITADLPVLLGGYSLAGLFALWAVYQSERFCGVAAVSPSVWFPNWMAYVKTHIPHVKKAYFSLGDREEKTKNRTMAVVGENIRTMQEVLQPFMPKQNHILEWNKGNHFQNTIERTARGFVWLLNEFEKNNISENRKGNIETKKTEKTVDQ